MLTLIATNLPRFVTCNGSVSVAAVPPFEPNDTTRHEGNAAHWLIEQVFKQKFGTDELVDRKAPNGYMITGEMVEHVTPFLEAIRGKGQVEIETSYGDGQRFQVNGRADWIGLDGTYLNIDDFKYGWSIVEPEKNWTLLSHAFGWLFANPTLAQSITHVTLRIWQPRPHHPMGKMRSVTYTIAEIWVFWAQLQAVLNNPDNMLHTGSHCYGCAAMANCPAAQKAGMNAIDFSETAYVSNLDNGSLAFLLEQSERAIKLLEQNHEAYMELALHRVKEGQIVPGYIAEKEFTNNQWKEGITVETAQLLTGKDLRKKAELITPAQAKKLGVPDEIMAALAAPRQKGVKLVRRSADQAVKKMFKEIINN